MAEVFSGVAKDDIMSQCDQLQAQLDTVRAQVRAQSGVRAYLAAQAFVQGATALSMTVAANAGLHE